GTRVNWEAIPPPVVVISTPSFTNRLPTGCDTSTYEQDTGLKIVAQPGDALTCLTYPQSLGDGSTVVTVTATAVGGSKPSFTQDVLLPPCPFTTSGLAVSPMSVTLAPAGSMVFVVAGGTPPYTVLANGGTTSLTSVAAAGDTFTYTAGSVTKTFSI